MAAVNKTLLVAGNYGINCEDLNKAIVRSRYFDFSAGALAAADVWDIFAVEAGMLLQAILTVTVVEGAADTIAIGDSAAAGSLLAATSVNALGTTVGTLGKLYTSADKVRLTPSAELAAAKIYVTIKGFRVY